MNKNSKTLCIIGGGGCAQIEAASGALKVIDELGIKVDEYKGSSAGAFATSLHASGMSGKEMERLIRATPVNRLFKLNKLKTGLRLLGVEMNSFYDAEGMADIMRQNTNQEGLEKVMVTVTRQNDEKSFMMGASIPSVMASGAIPLIFPAVKIGLYYYVDGGVTNMIPVPSIKSICNGIHTDYKRIIIIICPDSPADMNKNNTLIGKAVNAFLGTMNRQVVHMKNEGWNALKNVVVIQPPAYPVDLMSWSTRYELINHSATAAREAFKRKEGII